MEKIRARFKITKFSTLTAMRAKDPTQEYSTENSEKAETSDIVLAPVEPAEGDTNHENRQFWKAGTNGEIRLCGVEAEVSNELLSGREFWVDFTPVE